MTDETPASASFDLAFADAETAETTKAMPDGVKFVRRITTVRSDGTAHQDVRVDGTERGIEAFRRHATSCVQPPPARESRPLALVSRSRGHSRRRGSNARAAGSRRCSVSRGDPDPSDEADPASGVAGAGDLVALIAPRRHPRLGAMNDRMFRALLVGRRSR